MDTLRSHGKRRKPENCGPGVDPPTEASMFFPLSAFAEQKMKSECVYPLGSQEKRAIFISSAMKCQNNGFLGHEYKLHEKFILSSDGERGICG